MRTRRPRRALSNWLLRWLLPVWSLFALLATGWAQAQPVQPTGAASAARPAILLEASGAGRSVAQRAQWWLDEAGTATIDQVAAQLGSADFVVNTTEKIYAFRDPKRLWVRLDVQRPATAPDKWVLAVPLPLIDNVSLYQLGAAGAWQSQSAGDSMAAASWPEQGRYPRFKLDLPVGTSTVYLQVQSSTPVSLPIELASQSKGEGSDQLGYVALGMVGGALTLLIVMCFVMGYSFRDRLYALYGLYATLMMLSIAAYTGVGTQFLWNRSPVWADTAVGSLALLTGGSALLFISALLGVRSYSLRGHWLIQVWGILGPLLMPVYILADRYFGVVVLMVYIVVVAGLGLWYAVQSWRRHDAVGPWVVAAYLPLVFTAIVAMMRALGWLNISWITQYGIVLAMASEVPLLMAALNLRSRQRHAAQTREEAMLSQDALTGLLAGHLFQDRVAQAVHRSQRYREAAAVVLVSLVNHQEIVAQHGGPIAEQSVLRSVLKLRRILRDVDTAARVNVATFGLLLEGVHTKTEVTQACVRLVAAGLMPSKNPAKQVSLHFHFSAVLLHHYKGDGAELVQLLQEQLNRMSPRTRQPIRFLKVSEQGASINPEDMLSRLPPDMGSSSDPGQNHSSSPAPQSHQQT